MTIAELAEALTAARVDPDRYSLAGGLPNDAYCLERLGSKSWRIYYSERGSRFNEEFLITEDDACRRLLSILLAEPSVRLRPDSHE